MKKLLSAIALLAVVGIASADMKDATYTFSLVTTNADSEAYVLRGEIHQIYVDTTANKTATVAVTTSQDTIFSKSITADGVFYPVAPASLYTGAGLTLGTNYTYRPFVAAGAVTVTVTPAADTTGTNTYSVKVLYK